jgi:hypothetical protein
MTALSSVMPAQAGIQVLFEKVAHDLEREQMAKIFFIVQMAKPLNSDPAQRARVSISD